MIVTEEFIKLRNVPDIGSNPTSSEGYVNGSNNFTQ